MISVGKNNNKEKPEESLRYLCVFFTLFAILFFLLAGTNLYSKQPGSLSFDMAFLALFIGLVFLSFSIIFIKKEIKARKKEKKKKKGNI